MRILSNILYSKAKAFIKFPGDSFEDALNFGVSFIEQQDHIVEYIIANPVIMKKIFKEIPESKINVEGETIGDLWTSKLLVSDKLSDSQILFSNSSFSIVIDLNLNPNEV